MVKPQGWHSNPASSESPDAPSRKTGRMSRLQFMQICRCEGSLMAMSIWVRCVGFPACDSGSALLRKDSAPSTFSASELHWVANSLRAHASHDRLSLRDRDIPGL